ncbi:MAG: hypothetical protein F6K30_07225 [Cyanothece sp. SIO2G6]|nr:hypothetical protein [Cyanothece sp. SIO2G6]
MNEFDERVQAILDTATSIVASPNDVMLCDTLIEAAYTHAEETDIGVGTALAMAFDMCIMSEYYGLVANRGWLYCPTHPPMMLYPYVNICPRCILNDIFVFHKANKPQSGVIGRASSRWLALFYERLFVRHGRNVQVFKGKEPIDLVTYEAGTKTVLFAEIKAAPLATLPLVFESDELTELAEDGEIIGMEHTETDHTALRHTPISLFIPQADGDGWSHKTYVYGTPGSDGWSQAAMLNLVTSNKDFFKTFSSYWIRALDAYSEKNRSDNIYWFTNACGQPFPLPDNWPSRGRGASGYESVSDSKTSVGMDRTDDIKKGTYQVLKLSAELKPDVTHFHVKTGLLSNIHAVRHFDEYLEAVRDIIWTSEKDTGVHLGRDLDPDKPLYNLFDGIISFTKSIARDEWVANLFNFT